MLHIVVGGAGCGKSTFLMQMIQKKSAANQKVRTLVPEQFAFTYDKKLYAALGAVGFNQCITGSFRSLTAELLSEMAVAVRDPVDTVVKTVVLYRVLQRLRDAHALLYYAAQADRTSFLPEVQKQLSELMQSRTTPEALMTAATQMQKTNGVLFEKTMDIARIYADYLSELSAQGLRDSMCDLAIAATAADGERYLRDAILVLDEFESFTGDQYAMLKVMLRDAAEVWIALRTDDPDAPDYSRFDAVNLTCRSLRRMAGALAVPVEWHRMETPHRFHVPSLAHLSQYLFTEAMQPFDGEAAVTVTEARDITLEAEAVAATIRRLMMDGTAQCSEIMVVTHDLASYGPLLEAAFVRYEIPFFMDLRRSVLHTAVMKLPLCLLRLAQRTTTEQVLLFLKTQLSPLSPSEVAMLENYAFTWDIADVQWEQPFPIETDAEGIHEALRQTIMNPILNMRKRLRLGKTTAVNGDVLCETLYQCMEEAGIPMRVGGLAQRLKDQGSVSDGRALRRLWNRFTNLLDTLHDALTDTVLAPTVLAELLTAVLRENQIAVPPQTLNAVTVQSNAAARYDAPRIVFVMGANEGQFPADIHLGGFYTDAERNALSNHGIQLARSVRDLCADERLIVYKALSAASDALYVSYALANEAGKGMIPAAVLQQMRQLLPTLHWQSADRLGVPFYVSTRAAAYYSFVQDYAVTPKERATIRHWLERNPADAQRLEKLRRTNEPSRLRVCNPDRMKKLIGANLRFSATQIENTMQCPFRGFCENGLRLYPRRKNNLNPLSGGELVHFCMERLFRAYPTRDAILSLTEAELQAHTKQCADLFLQQKMGGAVGRTQRFLHNYANLTEQMVTLLKHTQAEMAQSLFVPDACELVIGKLGEQRGTAPYQITLPNGMTMTLNGRIDRVDTCQQGNQTYLRIVDYKTGAKIFSLADIYYGLNLQMLLYLFALMDDPSYYPDMQPAGVLYVPAGAPTRNRPRDDPQSITDYVNAHFRMSGTVLCDRGILQAMEAQLAGVYIPAALDAEDTGHGAPKLQQDSQVFTMEQLQRLRKYVETLLVTCAEQYAAGDVAPYPMKRSGESRFFADACTYCGLHDVCGLDGQDPSVFHRSMTEKQANEAMCAIMDGHGTEEGLTKEDSHESLDQ